MAAKHDTPPPTRSQALAERAGGAYSNAIEKVSDVAEKSPAAALAIGGLALGAIAGAILPRSAKERELLASTGERTERKPADRQGRSRAARR